MGKGIYGSFKTDTTAEKEGRWFEFPANDDGTIPRVKLARMSESNPRYQSQLEKLSKDFRREIELDILTEDRAGPVFRKLFIDTILLDWENIQDEQGNNIPFSKETAEQIFTDLPDFYRVLVAEAKRLSNFRADAVTTLAGK